MPVKNAPAVQQELAVLKQYWDAGIPEEAPFDQLPGLKALGMDKYRDEFIRTGAWAGNTIDQHLGGWGKLAEDAITDKGQWASIQRGVRKAAPVLGTLAAVAGVPVGGVIGKALGGGKVANAVGGLVSGHGTGLLGNSAIGKAAETALINKFGGKTLGNLTTGVQAAGLLGLDKTLQPPKPKTPDVSGIINKGAGWVGGQTPVTGGAGDSLGSGSAALGLPPGGLGGLAGGGAQQPGGLTAGGVPKDVWRNIREQRDELLGGGGAGGAGRAALALGLLGSLKDLIGNNDKAPAPAPAPTVPPPPQGGYLPPGQGGGTGWGINIMQNLPRFSERSLTGLPTGDDAADYAGRFNQPAGRIVRRGLMGAY